MTIQDLANTPDFPLSADLVKKWNSVIPVLKTNYIDRTITIDPNVAEKYKGDFTGLLLNLDVPTELHYPHLVVNGLNSPTDYKGDFKEISILNYTEAGNYYELFTSNYN